MIPHIRVIASAIQDDLREDAPVCENVCEAADDPGLDVLVRHAIHQEVSSHDAGHVWQKLSRRVAGPFGRIAIEEPALRGRSMPFLSHSLDHSECRPDSMRHSLFRTAEATFSMR
jgi:hypothetical protein